MGLFGSYKSKKLPWTDVTSVEDFHNVVSTEEEKVKLFFKHSTRCSISIMVLSSFEGSWNQDVEVNLYFVDLLKHRDVSNEIAKTFNVVHQSPQLIVVKGGEVIYSASHSSINTREIEKAIRQG